LGARRYILAPLVSGKLHPQDGITVRIGEDARKCVVFFGVPTPSGGIGYGGTGFLICYREHSLTYGYLLTAAHVADAVRAHSPGAVVRINRTDGTASDIDIEQSEWTYHQDRTVDLAIASFYLSGAAYDVKYYTIEGAHGFPGSPKYHIACGDPISIVGLFRLHPGSNKNTPIVHTGNIALLPDANEKVPSRDRRTGKLQDVLVYMIEAQTLEGLSGSPVFLREVWYTEAIRVPHDGLPAIVFGGVQLLGLYQGAWDLKPSETLANAAGIPPDLRVPVGMGLVVPSEQILELVMHHPDLKAARARTADEQRATRAATTDAVFPVAPSPGPADSADNPQHQEDFKTLLGAAAKKRPPTD
jgi:Trypsin-like peptidase domain